ncbi:MAG: hypothetical protein ACI8WB_001176 [Phenylobacterium sp.]|jgi:hypothetical protein
MPEIGTDREQLEAEGFSPAVYSKEFAAVVESCACELYSTLDGVRDIIFTVYNEVQGVQKKSNEKLFRKAYNNEYDISFPNELNTILASAYSDWFQKLRDFRTEMTHGSLGSTSMDHDSGKVRYFHTGMTRGGNTLIMEDFVKYISDLYSKVLALLNAVCDFLYENLQLSNASTMCGMYKARCYERLIEPELPLTNQSGYCVSRQWFDSQPEYTCPLAKDCGAYKRAISELKFRTTDSALEQ